MPDKAWIDESAWVERDEQGGYLVTHIVGRATHGRLGDSEVRAFASDTAHNIRLELSREYSGSLSDSDDAERVRAELALVEDFLAWIATNEWTERDITVKEAIGR